MAINTLVAAIAVICLVPLVAVLMSACALSSRISQIEDEREQH